MNLPVLPSTRGISRTDIEWADYAVGSPFRFRDKGTGQVYPTACVKVSAGCKNCYAESIGERFGTYLPFTKPNMDQLECFLDQGVIDHTLSFKPKPPKGETTFKNGRSRPAVFFTDTTDPFGDWVTFEQLDALFACFALRPDVDFLLLTKRPERMAEYWSRDAGMSVRLASVLRDIVGRTDLSVWVTGKVERAIDYFDDHDGIMPNVWLGCSVEDQKTADERIPHLLKCPAAVRFVSYEPALGPVDFSRFLWAMDGARRHGRLNQLHWIIVGGESGHDARPFNVEWGRSVVRQCADAGVPCFVKQLGANCGHTPERGEWFKGRYNKSADEVGYEGVRRLKSIKGSDPSEWPADLRVRQVPGGAA